MSIDLRVKKQIQREMANKAREALSAEDRRRCSRIVAEKLIAHPDVESAAVILSYRAFGAELDLVLFHEEIERLGKILAFPVPYKEGRMEAYCPLSRDSWTAGAYGIRTPLVDRSIHVPPEEIDVVVVPCIAFDGRGMRIGWGGGYYDRYLPRCTKAKMIGVAFEAQRLDEAAGDFDRDFRLDEVITERRDERTEGCV